MKMFTSVTDRHAALSEKRNQTFTTDLAEKENENYELLYETCFKTI
jgi:hypothetical protein